MQIFISEMEFERLGLDINDPNFSEIAVNFIQDNYFNGADSAVIYKGRFYNVEYDYSEFEFDLIPN